jgi:hypothetical protein
MINIDQVLEELQPPKELLHALKPGRSCTVEVFLNVPKPHQPGSRKINLEPALWFTANVPTETPLTLEDLVLPCSTLCEILDGEPLRKAVQNNHCSVQHPVKDGVFLPLWVTRAWKWGNVLLSKATFWRARLSWVEETADAEAWPSNFTERVKLAIMSSPWLSDYQFLQRGCIASTNLAMLLSSSWINDEQLDAMLDVVRADICLVEGASHVVIANTGLNASLRRTSGEAAGGLKFYGEKLESGRIDELLMAWNVDNVHWLSIGVCISTETINIGDSLPAVSKSHLPRIENLIRAWLNDYVPGKKWKTNTYGIEARKQLDTTSCGAATSNAIHHRLCQSVPLWNPHKPGKARAYYFVRCVEVGQGQVCGSCTEMC